MRAAAAAAGVSEGWWRQVALGWTDRGGGARVPATPSVETILAMAKSVGVETPVRTMLGLDSGQRLDTVRRRLREQGVPEEFVEAAAKAILELPEPEGRPAPRVRDRPA